MADERFYTSAGPLKVSKIAEITGISLDDTAPQNSYIEDVASLTTASREHLSFIDNRLYLEEFRISQAGAIFLTKDLEGQSPANTIKLVSKTPYLDYAKVATAFYPDIYPSITTKKQEKLVSDTARLGTDVIISPGAVIMDRAEIGDGTVIGPNSVIGPGVVIGANGWIGANATLLFCCIGKKVIIHSGVRIGQDGYGFAPGEYGHFKVPQLGRVMIGDDVEIGANSCIDRGSLADTEIGSSTKLDNLVHIAHNVTIGEGCFITGQVGIAGSSKIGNYVMMGGQSGISGHLSIGDEVKIAAQSGVSKNIKPGQTVAGYPAMNARKFWRNLAMLNKLTKQKR